MCARGKEGVQRGRERGFLKEVKEIGSFRKSMETVTDPGGKSSRIRACLVPLAYEH